MAQSVTTGSGRPWQGTALGVLNIISTVFSFLFGLLFLFGGGLIGSFIGGGELSGGEGADGIMGFFAGFAVVIGVVLIGVGILEIFMARGAFNGQKWSVITSIVFAVLGVVSGLSNFSTAQLLSLAVCLFTLYTAVVCVKHPYYKGQK